MRAILLSLLLLALAVPAAAATFRHAESYIQPAAEVLHDDLYALGKVMNVQGTVDGDLVIAGQTVLISGTVTGDVIAAGRDVTIAGHVGGTVRATGSNVIVSGTVAHDVVVAGGNIVIGPQAEVGRDVITGAGASSFSGKIARDVRVGGGTATFAGTVGGIVYAHAKNVQLNDGAVLEHDLLYTSKNELTKAPGATVGGKIERRVPNEEERGPVQTVGKPIVGWIKGLIGLLIFAGLFHLLFPGAGTNAVETLRRSPLASLGFGALIAFGVPCAAAFLFVVGIMIGGWWIGLAAVVVYLLALALGYVIAARYVGRLLLGRSGKTPAFGWAVLTGLVVLGLVVAIPFLGWIVGWAAALFGLGALAVTWYRNRPGFRPELAPVAT